MEDLILQNRFYQQWGLAIVLAAVIIPSLTLALRLMLARQTEIPSAALRIKSELSRRFQRTVIEESRKIFRLVEDRLFEALGDLGEFSATKTRFNYLLEEFGRISTEDDKGTEREQLVGALKASLSGIITGEVEKLFNRIKVDESKETTWIGALSNPRSIGFAFEKVSELVLSEIAKELEQTNRRVRWHGRSRDLAIVAIATLSIAGILILSMLAFNYIWAQWVVHTCLVAFCLAAFVSLVSLVVHFFLNKWLETRAAEIVSMSISTESGFQKSET